MKIHRRGFVKRSALSLGGIVAGASLANVAQSKPAGFDPYSTVPLGQSKLKLSRFCLGTGMRGSNRQSDLTRQGKEKAEALILGAYDRGIRTFDLADLLLNIGFAKTEEIDDFADRVRKVPLPA